MIKFSCVLAIHWSTISPSDIVELSKDQLKPTVGFGWGEEEVDGGMEADGGEEEEDMTSGRRMSGEYVSPIVEKVCSTYLFTSRVLVTLAYCPLNRRWRDTRNDWRDIQSKRTKERKGIEKGNWAVIIEACCVYV